MSSTIDRWKKAAGQVVDAAAKTTSGLMAKGRVQLDKLALQKKLDGLHKQLGNLVYTLRKTGESNELLIQQYVDEIDFVQEQLDIIQPAPVAKEDVSVHVCSSCGAGVQEDAMFCSGCGEKLS